MNELLTVFIVVSVVQTLVTIFYWENQRITNKIMVDLHRQDSDANQKSMRAKEDMAYVKGYNDGHAQAKMS